MTLTLKEYNHQYYEDNKERLIKNQLKKVVCPYCNTPVLYCNMSHHRKTKKHQALVSKYGEIKT
jgi:uncharacterized protein YbaR (Trm112 family)